MRSALFLLLCMFGAGPAWAGSGTTDALAWVAEYRVHDDQGDRTLVLVRSDVRVEYRMAGEPVRIWEKGGDGPFLREVFIADGRIVSFAPGDLRALGRDTEWLQLSHLVDPALRAQLQEKGTTKVSAARNAPARRYRGDVQGVQAQLDWLDAADLPSQYRTGKGRAAYVLELRSLEQRPVGLAFTATDGLREIDYADIGDMELDPFARRYNREGAGVAAEH